MDIEFPDLPEPELLCSLQAGIDEIEALMHESSIFLRFLNAYGFLPLSKVPECLWISSSTDIGRIKSAECIRIQVDHFKP